MGWLGSGIQELLDVACMPDDELLTCQVFVVKGVCRSDVVTTGFN